MSYHAPQGTVLLARLGGGTTFDVALVRQGPVTLVCKRLAPQVRHEPGGRQAMVREAGALALARHPAVPGLVRAGADAHGPFLLETRVQGVALRELVDRWAARGLAVPPSLVRHVGHSALTALAELHELADAQGPLGLVHGDLGPDHVLLGPIGEPGLVDFGAARFRGMTAGEGLGDRGTLPFVAPEVARAEAPPSAATDVYALAATLLFLAAGRSPCEATDEGARLLEIGERGVRRELLDGAAGLHPGERAALRAALSPVAADRPPTARALLLAMG